MYKKIVDMLLQDKQRKGLKLGLKLGHQKHISRSQSELTQMSCPVTETLAKKNTPNPFEDMLINDTKLLV